MYRINGHLHYLQSHVQYKSWSSDAAEAPHTPSFPASPKRPPSQDVVDGPGPGALRRAGLRVGAARGEGGRVPRGRRTAAGPRRGQAVHDAGEALQAGGSGGLVARAL